jgi:hypothetical protein
MKPVPQHPDAYYRRLLQDNRRVEIRVHAKKKWDSFWFDSEEKLFAFLNKKSIEGDFYSSLNAPAPRQVLNGEGKEKALTNAGVEWITRIPFDFDAERETGTPATDDQIRAAYELREEFLALMRPLGWSIPLYAFSGNGYHAQYRTRLPNNAEVGEMLDLIYRGIAGELLTEGAKFDVSVKSPGQIFRAYGTINRKGNRLSEMWIPPRWNQVRMADVAGLANYYAREAPEVTREGRRANGPRIDGKGDYRTLDVARWFQAHGHYEGLVEHGKHAVRCPFASEHTTPRRRRETVVWDGQGNWPTFHCSHAHCQDRTIRDVLGLWGDADEFCSVEYGRAS